MQTFGSDGLHEEVLPSLSNETFRVDKMWSGFAHSKRNSNSPSSMTESHHHMITSPKAETAKTSFMIGAFAFGD